MLKAWLVLGLTVHRHTSIGLPRGGKSLMGG
jgi:hypothetical protein